MRWTSGGIPAHLVAAAVGGRKVSELGPYLKGESVRTWGVRVGRGLKVGCDGAGTLKSSI